MTKVFRENATLNFSNIQDGVDIKLAKTCLRYFVEKNNLEKIV